MESAPGSVDFGSGQIIIVKGAGIQPSVRHDDFSPGGALTAPGLTKFLNWEGGIVVKGGQQGVKFLETGNLAEGMTDFPTYREPLKVPGHMLAHVYQTMHSLILHQKLGMTANHGAHLTQAR